MLYKYLDITNFKRFSAILLNSELYAANYYEMNDPMEGLFYYSPNRISRRICEELKKAKGKFRICSLSKTDTDPLMWAHYANGHKGVVLGVDVLAGDRVPVIYEEPPFLSDENEIVSHDLTAKNILTYKNEAWSYEKEIRYLLKEKSVRIVVNEIIFGSRTKEEDKELIRKLAEKACPQAIPRDSDVGRIGS